MAQENYDSPNFMTDHAGGQPALQAAAEAQERQRKLCEYREAHPGEYELMPSEDWKDAERDYNDIRRGQDLLGLGGGSFEAGDAFIPRRK